MSDRTADEIAHEAVTTIIRDIAVGEAVAVVIVSKRDVSGKIRTAFRFVHVGEDHATQARGLREYADLLEKKIPGLVEPS